MLQDGPSDVVSYNSVINS
jgi:leucine-rich PPR motif-containing protein